MPLKLFEAIINKLVLIIKASDNAGSPRLFKIAFKLVDKNKVNNAPVNNNNTKAIPISKLLPKPNPNNNTLYVSKPFCICSFPKPIAWAAKIDINTAINPHAPANGVKNDTKIINSENNLFFEKNNIP
jgi:hypothetical protein